jgi:hypothetical protein
MRYVIKLKDGTYVSSPNSITQKSFQPFFFNLPALKVFLLRWTGGNAGWLEGATVEIWEVKSEHPISVIRDKALTGGEVTPKAIVDNRPAVPSNVEKAQ